MNQKIVDYLQQNKNQYPKENLIAELKKSGFSEEEIKEGERVVYGGSEVFENDNGADMQKGVIESEDQIKIGKVGKRIIYSFLMLPAFLTTVVVAMEFYFVCNDGSCFYDDKNLFLILILLLFPVFTIFVPFLGAFFLFMASGLFGIKKKKNQNNNVERGQCKNISFGQKLMSYTMFMALFVILEIAGMFFPVFSYIVNAGYGSSKIFFAFVVVQVFYLAAAIVTFFVGRTTLRRCNYLNKKVFYKELLYMSLIAFVLIMYSYYIYRYKV